MGSRLAAVRASTGLSQGAFAEAIGLSTRAYANYERGEREMPVALFRALYAVYGIDPIWMLDGPSNHPLKAAHRTMNFALVDELYQWLDTELSRANAKLRPSARIRLLQAAYVLSAEHGRMNQVELAALFTVAVGSRS